MDVQLLHPILEAVVTLVLALGGVALGKYLQKLGLQVDAQKFFQQREVAQAVVLFIEEQFAANKKIGWETETTKQEEGVKLLQQQFPKLEKTAAEQLIDEAVIRLGLGAAANPRKPAVS